MTACPYPTAVAHPLPAPGLERCAQCERPLVTCAACGASNRVLSRHCRECGQTTGSPLWSTRGGEATSALLDRAIDLPRDLNQLWTHKTKAHLRTAAVATSGLFVAVEAGGSLQVFQPCGPLLQQPLVGVGQVLAAPALLQGLLLVATGDRLVAVDLVEQLGVSPGSGSRKRVFSLKGEPRSDVVSDGRRYAALATAEGGSVTLHVFELEGTRLQLLWSRTPGKLEDRGYMGLALVQERLLVGEPGGLIRAFSVGTGTQVGDVRIEEGLAPLPLLTRQGAALVAAADGALYRVEALDLRLINLAEPCEQPLFAFGASQQDIVACHGRLLRRVDLRSGRVIRLQIPQHCTHDPVVAGQTAVVVSTDGTVYVLDLTGDHFQAVASRKVLTGVEGTGAPPLWTGRHLLVGGLDGELVALGYPPFPSEADAQQTQQS